MSGSDGKDNGLKINRTEFSLKKSGCSDRSGSVVSGNVVKSSYEMSSELHRELRVFCAREGRKLNEVFEEAVRDLLEKYGK